MYNPLPSIQRQVYSTKYNVICGPTHERIESSLAKTNCEFYAWMRHGVFKPTWNTNFAPIPTNYHLLDERNGDRQLPAHIVPDLVLSQNRFGQYQILSQLARAYQIPLITYEHTCALPIWTKQQMAAIQEMRGHVNVFITHYSLESWQWQDRGDTFIIHHPVDGNLFKPDVVERKNHILSVGNDYIGRDSVLNFSQYKRVCLDKGLPVRPVGDTAGFSKAPDNVNELIKEYQTSRIFVNTHHISPIPTSLLEAAACGCACVSCNTCAIGTEFFTHGENALLYNSDEEMEEYLRMLLVDETLAIKLGENARKMIQKKCSVDRYVKQWNQVFDLAFRSVR